MQHLLSAVLLCLLCLPLSGQMITIKGLAVDSTEQPLVGASVVLLQPADSILVSFGLTDDKGAFEIRNVRKQVYTMQITYLGYGTFSRSIDGSTSDGLLDLGQITLYTNTNKLSEVTVTAEFIPIVVKKDTIEYNAAAFKVKPNATVEDLLKQLPGIEVEDDGSISAQGEDVKTVTVDGKKFFGNDPTMATRNLPADAVDKVQLIDQKSEKSRFTGVDDGEREKTINLELKEDHKQGIFGDVMVGGGTDDRYESKLNLNHFSDKWQISALANYNNINEQGFSYSDYYGLTGGNRGGRGLINSGGFKPGISTSLAGGLNTSYTPSDKLEITASYFITDVQTDLISNETGEYFLNDGSYFVDTDIQGVTQGNNHQVSIDLEYEPDTLNRWGIEVDASLQNNSIANQEVSVTSLTRATVDNTVIQDQNGDNEGSDIGIELEYGRRLRKAGRSITTLVEYGRGLSDDFLLLDQATRILSGGTGIRDSMLLQQQVADLDNQSYRIQLSYTEPLGNDTYLDINARRNNRNDESIRQFIDFDGQVGTLNEALSNSFDNSYNYNFVGLKLQKNYDNLKVTAGLDYKNSEIAGTISQLPEISNTFNFVLPSLVLRWDKQRINIDYSTATQEPSITQLSPIVDNSDPTNIYIGNPTLRPEYTHRLNARWYFWDSFTFRNVFANIRAAYTQDNIATSRIIDQDFVRRSTPVNVDDQITVSSNLNVGSPIRKLRIKARASIGVNYTNGINFINGLETDVTTTSQNINLRLENLDNDIVSIRVGGRLAWNQNNYNVTEVASQNFLTQIYNSDIIVDFGRGWTWDNAVVHTIYSQESFGENTQFTLWNSTLQKSIMKERLFLKLTVFDVLGQNQGINRSSGADFLSETVANNLTRYGMLSVIYKLSDFDGGRKGFRVFRM